ECVRRLFFVIFAPDSQQESSPLSGRKSTQATVRICGASSNVSMSDHIDMQRVTLLNTSRGQEARSTGSKE
ncbi:hypothetical protein, partial [Bradyrhizobium liaoningense]|uniref:hypothetical protein n=1 Tax=Bradyrhizobium liaoningense TaxID=43992 RepID=UPI0024E13205